MSVREQLRHDCATAHRTLEFTPLLHRVAHGYASSDDYLDYLQRQWALHVALERAAAPWLSLRWRRQRLLKADWLAADLAALGHTPRPQALDVRFVADTATALGATYVMEGATLGLAVIRRRLTPEHPAHAGAGRFVVGYGNRTTVRWTEFVRRLEAVSEADTAAMVAAALGTFALFLGVFADTVTVPPSRIDAAPAKETVAA